MHERLHETDLLSVSTRQRSDRTVELELEARCQSLRLGERRQLPQCGELREQLPRREVLVEAKVAGEIADTTPDRNPVCSCIQTEDEHPPRGRTDEVEHRSDRGRLAGPVRTEKAENLAASYRQIEIDDTSRRSI
jgi:hypothetical protein